MKQLRAAPRLTLVGTVHREKGAASLRQLLTELRPDLLTLEMSPYALAFRQRRGPHLIARLDELLDRLAVETGRNRRKLAAHPEIAGIRRLLALPFEYRAAAAYAETASVPLALLDQSLISARKLRLVETELISPGNLRALLALTDSRPVAEGVKIARAMLLGETPPAVCQAFLASRRGAEGIGRRDAGMAAKIRQFLRPGHHLVHIGGWLHLMEDPRGETLYSRLQNLHPVRLLLDR